MSRKIIWHIIRIGVAAGLIAYVISGIDFGKLLETLKGSSISVLVGALAFLALQPALGALRWQVLLKVQGIRLSFLEAVRLTYLGLFFNNCMPTSVGGDAVKAYYIAKQTQRKAESIVAIFVDRMVGIGGLIILGAVVAVITIAEADKRFAHITIGIAFVAFFGAFLLFFSRRLRGLFRAKRWLERLPSVNVLRKVNQAVFVYRFHKAVVLLSLVYTGIVQLLGILAIWLIGIALGADTSFHLYLLYMPVVWLVWFLPISVNGLGTVEATFLYFFNAAVLGVASSAEAAGIALAMILLFRIGQFVIALPGVVLYILRRTGISVHEMQREIAGAALSEAAGDE